MKKVSVERFNVFCHREFYGTHLHETLRLGQAFLNKFYPDTLDPELFYMKSNLDAIEYIYNHYLEDFE
jgi:hypothetical protein